MDYRVDGAATHHGKGMVTGVDGLSGIEQVGSTIVAASDSAAAGLTVKAKGTGTLTLGDSSNTVLIGGSTTPSKFVSGQSTTTIPNMPGASQAVSTLAATGISTGDIILAVDSRGDVSTHVAMGGYRCTAAGKITVVWTNCHASSIAAESTGITVRWCYLDRT